MTEDEIIRKLEEVLGKFKQLYDSLKERFPSNDLRPAAVGMSANILHSYLLFYAMANYTLVHKSWWKEAYRKDELSALDIKALRNLEAMTKHSFFTFFLSKIEWTFRKCLRLIVPNLDPIAASFKKIYEHILSDCKLKHYIPLLNLSRLCRNTIHSNGIHTKLDELVLWKDIQYEFKHMLPIEFFTHETFFLLIADLFEMLRDFIDSPKIKALGFIEDRVH